MAAARSASSGVHRKVADSDQVVYSEREGKHPIDARCSPVACLPHQPDRLEPAEDLLDALAPALADGVPRMARRAPIDGAAPAACVLRDMRGDAEQSNRGDEVAGVVAL